jgi:glycosyltransferase involved in cell wall biosynthesis
MSIVLPVLNEAQDIGRLLGEIMNQTPPVGGFEVLVVDGGSTDATRNIVADFGGRWPNIRLLSNPRKLSSAGRNIGARAAKGKYVLFLDGHCALPRSDYLTRAVEVFESTGAACLCRPQPINRLAEGKWAGAISTARHSWLGHDPASDIYGGPPAFTDPHSAGAAYLRTCIDRLGGYDERFDACEDVEFNHRVAAAGLPSYRHPDLTVDYRPRSSMKALLNQMYRYGRGRAHLMARHPSVIPWPLVLITGYLILTLLTLALVGPKAAGMMTAIPIGLWMLLMVTESTRLAGFTPAAARVAVAFLVIHLGLEFGFWRGIPEFRRFRSPVSS